MNQFFSLKLSGNPDRGDIWLDSLHSYLMMAAKSTATVFKLKTTIRSNKTHLDLDEIFSSHCRCEDFSKFQLKYYKFLTKLTIN